MSKTRVGRNPFDKKQNASHGETATATASAPSVTTEEKIIPEEQIIGELIDLAEENWQPLTAVPSPFLKQIFARWM
jgi:hypothetical protein